MALVKQDDAAGADPVPDFGDNAGRIVPDTVVPSGRPAGNAKTKFGRSEMDERVRHADRGAEPRGRGACDLGDAFRAAHQFFPRAAIPDRPEGGGGMRVRVILDIVTFFKNALGEWGMSEGLCADHKECG